MNTFESSMRRFTGWASQLYQRTVSPQPTTRTAEITKVLRSVPLFTSFTRSDMQNFAEALHIRSYRKDEYLYRERDPGLGMYIIQSGRVRLLTEDEEGNLHEVQQLGDFEIVGEFALLGDFRRLETAQAVTDSTVLGFFRPELKSMLRRDSKTAALLLSALAEHVSGYYVRLSSMLIEKEGKMAGKRLINASKNQGIPHQDTSSFIVR